MNHFLYAMTSTAPAPAAGGDTKSWFYYYKWDVEGLAFVPVAEELLDADEPAHIDTLWFVMDGVPLGCCPVHSIMPSLGGPVELHYDTRLIQVLPADVLPTTLPYSTGLIPSDSDEQKLFDNLKKRVDKTYPPRDEELASSLGLRQSNEP